MFSLQVPLLGATAGPGNDGGDVSRGQFFKKTADGSVQQVT